MQLKSTGLRSGSVSSPSPAPSPAFGQGGLCIPAAEPAAGAAGAAAAETPAGSTKLDAFSSGIPQPPAAGSLAAAVPCGRVDPAAGTLRRVDTPAAATS